MDNIIEDAFNYITEVPIQPLTGKVAGLDQLNSVQTLQIGTGAQAFHGDQSGIWLGGEKFANAPFSVDMLGNVIANTGTFGQYLSKTDTGQILSGDINVGSGGIIIDGANERIIMNDGSDNRVLIGAA